MKIAIVIPARLDSTRLKHKMLIDFNGQPLIKYVFDRVRSMGYDTYVVTDSNLIGNKIPVKWLLKTGKADNGTHRISKVVDKLRKYNYIINIQGDMVDIDAWTLKPIIAECKKYSDWDILTAYTEGAKPDDVKVIHNYGKALWFTRSDIGYGDRHLGIYAYTPRLLQVYDLFDDKYPKEDLEQNRILGYYKFNVIKTEYDGIEINTKKDIDSWTLQSRG
jgi:3-deoxy-manno-octulosonate cytidylyltransferase (CMP-KDO synthetase)